MGHKITNVIPMENHKLKIFFSNGVSKIYDMDCWINAFPRTRMLFKIFPHLFSKVKISKDGYGISWKKYLEISSAALLFEIEQSFHLSVILGGFFCSFFSFSNIFPTNLLEFLLEGKRNFLSFIYICKHKRKDK